jgi:hypothetical protein
MRLNKRKIVNISFLLFTIVFAGIVGYTTHVYFIVYVGVQNIQATIPYLNVQIVNSSYILVETPISIQNPSECIFELLQITQGLYLEKPWKLEQILISSRGWDAQTIPPRSTANVTIQAEVPSTKISDVMTYVESKWIANVRIHFQGPMVGIFSWQNVWPITEVLHTE